MELVMLYKGVIIWGNGFREMYSNKIIFRFILFYFIRKRCRGK